MSNLNQTTNKPQQNHGERREAILEESRVRCSRAYTKIFEIFCESSKTDDNDLETILASLKPKERKMFEQVISLIKQREGEIKELCETKNPKELFKDLFGFEPFDNVSLEFDPKFPILEIGAIDSYKIDNFAGIGAITKTEVTSEDEEENHEQNEIYVNVVNRDAKIKGENPSLEQKARFVLSISKIFAAIGNNTYNESAESIINALTGKITWTTKVSTAVKTLFDKFNFKKQTEKLYATFEPNVEMLKNHNVTRHEFRHVLQEIISKSFGDRQELNEENVDAQFQALWYSGYRDDHAKKGAYTKLFEKDGFFNRPEEKLNEAETEGITSTFNSLFKIQKKSIKFKTAQEFSSHLYDNRGKDYAEISNLIIEKLLSEIYVKRFTNFESLREYVDYKTDSEGFVTDGKYETQPKIDAFSEQAKTIFLQ